MKRVNLRFYLDPETGEPHIYSHGVTEEEVEDVMRNPGEARPGRPARLLACDRSHAGGSRPARDLLAGPGPAIGLRDHGV